MSTGGDILSGGVGDQVHGNRLSDVGNNLEPTMAEQTATERRYEAAGWLRKMVGVVAGKDLPAEPSEEGFRLGLRSGKILCNVLNKIHTGAIPKVLQPPSDPLAIPDEAALSAFHENLSNFLGFIQGMGIPTFKASDLEKGGNTTRVVNSILALKSFNEWKQRGGTGAHAKAPLSRTYSEPLSISPEMLNDDDDAHDTRSLGNDDRIDAHLPHDFSSDMMTKSLNSLVRRILCDKRPEEIPMLVESMLSKVAQEFEGRLESHTKSEDEKPDEGCCEDTNKSQMSSGEASTTTTTTDMGSGEATTTDVAPVECVHRDEYIHDDDSEELKTKVLRQRLLLDKQKKELEELRRVLHSTREGIQCMETQYQEEMDSLGKYFVRLAHSAAGYQEMAEENRKLYNQVQDLKGSIRVYCRVRPMSPGESNQTSAVDHIDEGQIRIVTPSKYGKEGHKSFRFNKVFAPSATQEAVFSDTRPLIRSVLDGYNVCIFAYGQTGSGKTHTMTGPEVLTEETVGVNYRALNDLFFLAEQRKDTFSYEISVQMIEIYNEQVRDLLVTDGLAKKLEIRNTSQKGPNVPDANMMPVASTSDVIELMNTGHKNRAVSATAANDRSSRSHSCLTIHVKGRDLTSGSSIRGCMHLVDLAGSERVNKSEATGDRLKEAQHINKSLSALGDVIASLAQKNSHVPYRNSKLTQLLQDSLGGQAKTLMFVHIAPEYDAVGETLSTLKFAERVATVELGTARPNQEGASGEIKELKEQIAILKEALWRKEGSEQKYVEGSPCSSPERVRSSTGFDGGASPGWGTEKPLEEKGVTRREWVDVVKQNIHQLVNKEEMKMKMEGSGGGEEGSSNWDRVRLPNSFYQKRVPAPDSSKVFPDQPFNKLLSRKKESPIFDIPRSRFDASSGTDDSEDLEATTSDCSEPDMVWQFSLPNTSTMGGSSKMKKPLPKFAKSPDQRPKSSSSIPTFIPSPSRKVSPAGYRPPLHQNGGKQQLPNIVDGKRRSVQRK